MNRNILPLAVICFSVFVGCKSESDLNDPFPVYEQARDTTSRNNIPGQAPQISPSKFTVPPATATANTSTMLNPAHGEPGHRCDIAVGAPLNSSPKANQVTTSTVQPIVSTPVPVNKAVVPATTAAGMNPPHGQPGHRCDIAVGAPLNSSPANKQTASSTVQTVTSPAQYSTLDKTTVPATAPGMNPPHGQPGHRCDIAVGAPLNSKPVEKSAEQIKPVTKDTSSGN